MTTKKATKAPAKKTAETPAKAATKTPAKSAAKKAVPVTAPTPDAASKATATHHDIAILAEQLWIERGRPHGSSHIDWHHAEQKLNG